MIKPNYSKEWRIVLGYSNMLEYYHSYHELIIWKFASSIDKDKDLIKIFMFIKNNKVLFNKEELDIFNYKFNKIFD